MVCKRIKNKKKGNVMSCIKQEVNSEMGFLNEATIKQGTLNRPAWICSMNKQWLCLVLDSSISMIGEKTRLLNDAVRVLLEELASVANKDGFHFCGISYDEKANIIVNSTSVKNYVNAGNSLIVNSKNGNGTNIKGALELAKQQLDSFQNSMKNDKTHFLKPVIFLLSDGIYNVGGDPLQVANELKKTATVVTIGFGHDAAEDLLLNIATTKQHYRFCNEKGSDLREFLATVGATLSATRAAGQVFSI